jgi:Secretion system C-terminal sorting domain
MKSIISLFIMLAIASFFLSTTALASISTTITKSPIFCVGDSSTVIISATGTNPPFTGTGTFKYPAGTYTIIVIDNIGAKDTNIVSITQPAPLNTTVTFPSIICHGDNVVITTNTTGGNMPYTTNYQNGQQFLAGNYLLITTDNRNCKDTTTFNITEPPIYSTNAAATKIKCNGDQALLSALSTGGVPPYMMSINGLSVGNPASKNVGVGIYTVNFVDANNCSYTSTVTVTQPSALILNFLNLQPTTAGFDLTFSYFGGTSPYIFELYRMFGASGTLLTTTTTLPISITNIGDYKIVLRDTNGCTTSKLFTADYPFAIKNNTINNFSILQNPFSNIIQIENINLELLDQKMVLINSVGQIVLENKIKNTTTTLHTNELPNGIYFLKIGKQYLKLLKQ